MIQCNPVQPRWTYDILNTAHTEALRCFSDRFCITASNQLGAPQYINDCGLAGDLVGAFFFSTEEEAKTLLALINKAVERENDGEPTTQPKYKYARGDHGSLRNRTSVIPVTRLGQTCVKEWVKPDGSLTTNLTKAMVIHHRLLAHRVVMILNMAAQREYNPIQIQMNVTI